MGWKETSYLRNIEKSGGAVMISIKHNLGAKVDRVGMVSLKFRAAVDEALMVSVADVQEDIRGLVGDKYDWFDVQVDMSNDSIKISPTSDVRSSDEKMRLYSWFITNYGEQIKTSCSECLRKNLIIKYKEHGLGGNYGY